MMYLVNTFVAGATAVELRNLSIDDANDKVEFNGHGFADGDILRASASKAGLTQDKMYVVYSKTANDFKLKAFNVADATGGAAVDLTAQMADSHATTLKKYGSKKCLVTDATKDDDKIHCSAQTTFKKADKLMVYCHNGTSDNKCTLDVWNGATGDLGNLKEVYAREEDQTSFTVTKTAPATDGTVGTAIDIVDNIHANTPPAKPWLLSVDSGSIYALATKTIGSDGAYWDVATSTTDGTRGYCGAAACGFSWGDFVWYTATGTATTGLTDKHVYWVEVQSSTPYKFRLKDTTVATAGGLDKVSGVSNFMTITAGGKGNTYKKVAHAAQITATTTADNKVTCKGKQVAVFANDTVLTYYCPDATSDKCKYNITGAANGGEFKIKSGEDVTSDVKVVLKSATSGTDAIVVTANHDTAADGGYMLVMDSGAATIFPPGDAGSGSAGSGSAGSAARSFAMLGSAFAMATAFLLA